MEPSWDRSPPDGSARERTDRRRGEDDGGGCSGGLLARGLFAPELEVAPAAAQSAQAPSLDDPPSEAEQASTASRRRRGRAEPSPRGRASRIVPDAAARRDVAWLETLLAAAVGRGRRGGAGTPPRPQRQHLRRWERRRRPGRLVLFVVDASGSMGAELVAVARRLALEVLEHAYVHRDRVALVAFRGERAELVLPPTTGAERVHRALGELSFGGTTPLAAALELAGRVLSLHARGGDEGRLVLISDGRGNVGSSPGQRAVRAEIEAVAHRVRDRAGAGCVLLDASEQDGDERPARRLARALSAERIPLWRARGPSAAARRA